MKQIKENLTQIARFAGPLFLVILIAVLLSPFVFAGTIPNPLGDDAPSTSIPSIVGRVIKGLLGITGAAALVMFIYGGAVWMTAMGEDKKVKQGWDTMVWAAMGMAVIFGSYAVVRYVATALLGSPPT